MIDPTKTRYFRFSNPPDVLQRIHRYRIYYKSRFLRQFSNISDVYKYCNHASFPNYVVLWQYLGVDDKFYTFQKEYLYQPNMQLLLFN